MTGEIRKYLQYIRNAGNAVPIAHFDEDWEPIGPMVRANLGGYVQEIDGKLSLTASGMKETKP